MKNLSGGAGFKMMLAITLSLWSVVAPGQHQVRPNIILILTDDLGWSSLSSRMDERLETSRSDYHDTPHIARMIQKGMRFSRGYAPDPICSPSRRSIQFGQTSIRQGDEEFARRYGVKGDRIYSIPEMLKSVDPSYVAAHFGKWDLRAGITPADLGYDESDGDTGNKEGNFSTDKDDKWGKKYLLENPKQIDSLTQKSIRFVSKQASRKTPFFLQVSHYATHLNFETRSESYRKLDQKRKGGKHDNPAWAGMIHDLDSGIGELLRALDIHGLTDHTYVFFMADNGGVEFIPTVVNRLDHPSLFNTPMRNAPLRGGKWTLYEGGIRVPFVVMGPGIKPGVQCDVPVAGWDLLPTFGELAGKNADSVESEDGVSLAGLLKEDIDGPLRRRNRYLYFHRFHSGYPHSAVIDGNYKLIHFWKTGKTELYDLGKDTGETLDVFEKQPETAHKLREALFSYIRRVNPQLAQQYLSKQ